MFFGYHLAACSQPETLLSVPVPTPLHVYLETCAASAYCPGPASKRSHERSKPLKLDTRRHAQKPDPDVITDSVRPSVVGDEPWKM